MSIVPLRLGDLSEPELNADDLHDAVVASVEAHRPSSYFRGTAKTKFSEPLSLGDCEEIMDCKKNELN